MKYKGLKRVAGESKNLKCSRMYLQICLDISTNEVFSRLHSINGYSTFRNDNIRTITFIDYPVTMKELESIIDNNLKLNEMYN